MMPKLIAFAGLPGTGKTTLATRLAAQLGALLMNKDEVRSKLFSSSEINYTDEQNDLCMAAIYDQCAVHFRQHPAQPIIIDGRTYSKKKQVDALSQAADSMQCQLHVIECRCSLTTAMSRIEQDQGNHLAADRTVEMLKRVEASSELLTIPRLMVFTDEGTTDEHLSRIMNYLQTSK